MSITRTNLPLNQAAPTTVEFSTGRAGPTNPTGLNLKTCVFCFFQKCQTLQFWKQPLEVYSKI